MPLGILIVACFFVFNLLHGCGTVGPPVPPETVGIGAKIQRDKEKEEKRRKLLEQQLPEAPKESLSKPGEVESADETEDELKREEAAEEEDVTLPPLRPIGTPR
jgi:hypothetical protein